MHSTPHRSLSSSFSSYSSDQFAEIAARVVEEVRNESNLDPAHEFPSLSDKNPRIENGFPKESEFHEEFGENCQKENGSREELSENAQKEGGFHEEFEFQLRKEANVLDNSAEKLRFEETEEKEEEIDDEFENLTNEETEEKEEEIDEFEFPLIARNSVSSPAPADEIFHNGQILPMYSFTSINSQPKENGATKSGQKTSTPVRMPLRLLFLEDTDPSSCSSSEADDLDGVAPETYCVWEPKTTAEEAEEEEGQCRKSNSTGSGSSKRWKFKNFLNRSNSEGGRDRIVFPAPDENNGKKRDEKFEKSKGVSGKATVAEVAEQYVKCGGSDKRRQSLLPYRQDMMGFFGNANGTNWNLHPF